MRKNYALFTCSILLAFACSNEKEESVPSTPLSEQALEFEIYDSLVVDYLENLSLMVSPDEK